MPYFSFWFGISSNIRNKHQIKKQIAKTEKFGFFENILAHIIPYLTAR